MSGIFVVRQPIFNRTDSAVGYELRFRDSADGDDPFARALASGTLDILRSGLPAFVSCSEEQLLARRFEGLDRRMIALLLPPGLSAGNEIVGALRDLSLRGIALALDEVEPEDLAPNAPRAPLLGYVSFVRVDLRTYDAAALPALAAKLKGLGKRLLADHVLDTSAHRQCKELGFDGFQGPHFSRPEPLPAAELPTSTISALRLLSLARDMNSSDRDIERTVAADPVVALELLRLVNSASTGGRGIESIGHALRLVGRSAFVRWLAVAVAASRRGKSDVDIDLIQRALLRARLCESVARRGDDAGALFLVGLFSMLDSVFRMPLADVLASVRLSPEVGEALLERTGRYADALNFVEQYELGLWEGAATLADALGVPRDTLPDLYASSVAWAAQQIASRHADAA
jgi:EAL and modified HD-GYP domain-containing signal transduction protein